MTPTTGHNDVLDGSFEPPSARVVMIGAGQLARMTHQAAIDYGIAFHVLAATARDPAVTAGAAHTLGRYDCYRDLAAVAGYGQVLTFDHELVPLAHLYALEEADHLLRPNARALAFAQDKLHVRRQLAGFGHLSVPMPTFAPASTIADVTAFAAEHGWPVVLKARGGGYDGRGVHVLAAPGDASRLLPAAPSASEAAWVLEEHLQLAAEFSILVARRPSGYLASYPPVGTRQEDGMCRELIMPAQLAAGVVSDAIRFAESIVAGLDATGICAVEFFWTTDGRLLLNELALRPHNSGHATIEACATSQFHQHLRAVLDWPLGPTTLVSPAATVNLIGGTDRVDLSARLPAALNVPGAHVHLYAKTTRPGRKIGHVTALGVSTDEALETARVAAGLLTQP
ncbi:MAG: 5-(carboxyamino)imidazole ribonucleotide synthase [Acidimicrobiales bacterium]